MQNRGCSGKLEIADALLAERDSVLRCSEMWRERGLRLVEARGLRVEAEARGLQGVWARPPPQEQEHNPRRNFDSTRGYPGEGPAAPNKDGRKKASRPRKLDQQETAAQGQGPHQKPAVGGILGGAASQCCHGACAAAGRGVPGLARGLGP